MCSIRKTWDLSSGSKVQLRNQEFLISPLVKCKDFGFEDLFVGRFDSLIAGFSWSCWKFQATFMIFFRNFLLIRQSVYTVCKQVASCPSTTFPKLWKSISWQKFYVKCDGSNILMQKCLLYPFKIGFVVHIVSRHHDDFIFRDWIGIVMVHQHAINNAIAQWLYFALVTL